jgi:uncharacterized protein YndB with AHSA1/START domain
MAATLRFEVARTVHAANESIWRVVGDFGNEHHWTKTLSHCERDTGDVRVGTARRCTLPRPLMGRNWVREIVTEFVPGKAISYELEGPAGPFASAASRWSTSPISGDSARVTVEGRFTARNWLAETIVWPVAKPMLRRLTRSVIDELEAYLVLGLGS